MPFQSRAHADHTLANSPSLFEATGRRPALINQLAAEEQHEQHAAPRSNHLQLRSRFPAHSPAAAAMASERHHSIDAQLRALAPGKVSEELIQYDALLVDRFLDILQDLHGPSLREFVQECYEVSADYEGKKDTSKLGELGAKLTGLAPADAILVASSILHMLNLANLAEEVELAHRRRNSKLKHGDFSDEGSATTESDIEETLKRLVSLGKTPAEVFEALKNQSVDLVFTAHPTQSARRSLLQKNARIRNCLTQLSAKDVTVEDKKELDEALHREIQAAFRTDEIRRAQPTPQDEMRYGMSYIHETVWNGVPKFLRRVDTALKNIGINERLPYDVPLIKFCSWMGGDRDGIFPLTFFEQSGRNSLSFN